LRKFRIAGFYTDTIIYVQKLVFLMHYCPLCKNENSFIFM